MSHGTSSLAVWFCSACNAAHAAFTGLFSLRRSYVQRALEQAKGWTDFINCMRAYLEFGVQLRKGRTKDLH
jgi:hypothetical protein